LQIEKRVQEYFKTQSGLLVDHAKPGGSGGRFFRNLEISANITGIDKWLIKNCSVILEAISSGFQLNVQVFKNYALETAQLYVQLYPWYYMPASMHKILIHGTEIIEHALLPKVQLSEEAQETRNKDLKLYRRSRTRKVSRETTTRIYSIYCLFIGSLITSLRKLPQKLRKSLSAEVLQLLSPPSEEEQNLMAIMSDDMSEESSETLG
jgi:hypothetical protein